jgi:hypothetical protein
MGGERHQPQKGKVTMKSYIVSYHQQGFFHDAVDPDSTTMELLPWIESELINAPTKHEAVAEFHRRNIFYPQVEIVGVLQV